MIVQDKIADYLMRSVGKSYCDDCLSSTLDIPPQAVQQETSTLAEEGWLKRSDGQCACCGLTKLVSKRRISGFAA